MLSYVTRYQGSSLPWLPISVHHHCIMIITPSLCHHYIIISISRSSASPKQSSLSPSSGSDHSSSRSPPTYPPPPTSVPPPLPVTQTRGHTHHSTASIKPPNSVKRQNDQKPYEVHMAQYGGHPVDPAYSGRGLNSKPHPQYPPNPHASYQNQSDGRSQSHSVKQSGSGSKSTHPTEVVNSTVIPTKQYATSLTDQSMPGNTSDASSERPPEHPTVGGDPGVRECPSGASSPGGTPNNTLGKASKMLYHYDPLASSLSESKLGTGGTPGGEIRGVHQPPQDGMDTQSDTNLLNYPHSGVGGVVYGRAHGLGKAAPKAPNKAGVKGTIRNWENRGTAAGDRGEVLMPARVLHHPISTAAKRGGTGLPNGSAAMSGRGMLREGVTIDEWAILRIT